MNKPPPPTRVCMWQRPEDGVKSPRTRVIVSYELPAVGTGNQALFSARAASVSSVLGLTLKKVLQVRGHCPWGPATHRRRLHLSPELSVQILFLQAHQGTHQSLGTCTLLHFSPRLGAGVAEGKQKRVGRRLTSGLEDLPNIYPTLQPDATHASACSSAQLGRQVWLGTPSLPSLSLCSSTGCSPSVPVFRLQGHLNAGNGGIAITKISGYSLCAICSGISRPLAVGQGPCWVLSECQRASYDCHILRTRRSKGDLCPGVIPGANDSAKRGR